jgi:UDP-N-acetylglucosamine 2-epimerase (non-hydrolysing)
MKKILLVFGTRPEAIKMAPLVKEFQKYPKQFEIKVCVTAQHRQMLDQVLDFFEIEPDFDLDIMAPNQDLFDITSKVLLGLRAVLNKFKADIVIVHGDTTTSMAASLAAFYKQIKIAHVEAGLRTYNLKSPWPEEMNRQVTDRMCDYYFAPTKLSKQNLLEEKINENKIIVTGNTVVDALFYALKKINANEKIKNKLNNIISEKGYKLSNVLDNKRELILITGHRRENFGDGFQNICKAIQKIALNHPEIDLVYPVHLNPNVQKPVYDMLSNLPNVFLIEPLDYLPFIFIMQHCKLVLTDSGGIQEEAPSLGKPVLVLRDTTERPEALEAGTVKLVGTSTKKIIENVEKLLSSESIYQSMSQKHNPYGDGTASQVIINFYMNEK